MNLQENIEKIRKMMLSEEMVQSDGWKALDETIRRRNMQIAYNMKHNITPETICKPIKEQMIEIKDIKHIPSSDIPKMIFELKQEMKQASDVLDFERAIFLRDKIKKLRQRYENRK